MRSASRTNPIPEYQPIPQIHVSRNTTARFELTVGADGRVKEVNVRDGVPGETAKLIAAVQSWRFRPATQNGQPVQAPFTVDISFHGDE
jgi:TonB family protein